MEEIIKIAQEGGYDLKSKAFSDTDIEFEGFSIEKDYEVHIYVKKSFENALKEGYRTPNFGHCWIDITRILLDPLFWQALFKGKSCHHIEKSFYPAPYRHEAKCEIGYYEWEAYALRTLEIILTEGMDKGIEYLKSIVVK